MMHRYFMRYSDIVFIDTTQKTNKYDMSLVTISGISSDNKNIVLAFALIQKEQAEVYEWILRKLKDFSGGLEPRCIITDYDLALCTAIERVYSAPKSGGCGTTHLLC